MSGKFYVYAYRNPLKGGEVFYVGKGFDERVYDHIKPACRANDRNLHKVRTIDLIEKSGIPPVIDMVGENLSEVDAFALEIATIAKYGRSDLGLGSLTNLTDGGEGLCGLVRDLSGENNPNYGKRGENSVMWGFKHSEETIRFLSESQKGKVFSEEHKSAMRKPKSESGRAAIALARKTTQYRPSEETKRLLSVALKGRPSPMKGRSASAETKAKQSAATKGVPKSKEPCSVCGMMCAPNVLHRWHMDNCRSKL